MSPERTGPDGWYRLDRVIAGVGRIRVRSGRTIAMHRRVDALVTKIFEQGRLEELRQLRSKAITSMQLVDADRRNAKTIDPSALKLAAPLWATGDALFPKGASNATATRYRSSLHALRESEVLDPDATIRDLASIDWSALEAAWPYSAADWNHLGRAISRLLTLHLGQHHPFRVALLAHVPKRTEVERLVELTPDEFRAIIAPAEPVLRDVFWTLAATGLRSLAEYQKLTEKNLGTYAITVADSKNPESHRVIPVDPKLWPHVRASVPAALKGDYISRAWRDLADRAGRPDLVLRDLRHCYGFWSVEAGIELNVIRDAMGHRSLATTQRYLKQRARRQHATALADVLVPEMRAKKRKRA